MDNKKIYNILYFYDLDYHVESFNSDKTGDQLKTEAWMHLEKAYAPYDIKDELEILQVVELDKSVLRRFIESNCQLYQLIVGGC